MSRSVVLLLVHFSYLWKVMLCSNFYVTASTNDKLQCSVVHCTTLAQLAANYSAYLEPAENITLVLQPGHHQLNSELTISNIGELLITSDDLSFDIPSVGIKWYFGPNLV